MTITSRAPGGIAFYRCNTGNNLIGLSTRSCQTDGTWSGNAPTCQGDYNVGKCCHGFLHNYMCVTIQAVLLIVLSQSMLCFCVVQYACKRNFSPHTIAPQCPTLPPPLNGRVSASGGTATYTCLTGYTLSGSSTRTCQTNGAWSGTAPTCGKIYQ